MVAIASYACHFPQAAVTAETLRTALGAAPRGLTRKRVAGPDEDALTLALAAARDLPLDDIPRGMALASMSLPYARRVQAGLLVDGLGLAGAGAFISEHTTSARAGTEALTLHAALTEGWGGRSVVVAAEAARGHAGAGADARLGAGAAALLLAPSGGVASLLGSEHYAAEDPGLAFSLAGEQARRDVEVPGYAAAAYQRAIGGAVDALLPALDADLARFRFVVLDVDDPRLIAKALGPAGLQDQQWRPVWPYPQTGELGAAGALVGLCVALDGAAAGDWILVLSYGGGSAADAIAFEAGHEAGGRGVEAAVQGGVEVDFAAYLKLMEVI
ncbi:MAG TPA: hypothetical protein VML96_00605 [Egibacteraceae bacterium]|nr:hypothetical protein [Egibacteraceae bacterium]